MENNIAPVYLKARYNQAISLTITQSDNMQVPIIYYSETQDIYVNLSLTKLTKLTENGVEQVLTDTVGVRNVKLGKQADLNSMFTFGTILEKRELPTIGVYTGNIVVKRRYATTTDPNDRNDILDIVPVIINIEPNPLSLQTEFLLPDGINRYSIAEIMTTLYNHLYVSPRYATMDENGEKVVRYSRKRGCERVLIFRSTTNYYLPNGSGVTIKNNYTGKVEGLYSRYDGLIPTNHLGQDRVTLEQITKDGHPASYIVIGDLPIGEYTAYAEYVGAKGLQQTPHINFNVD